MYMQHYIYNNFISNHILLLHIIVVLKQKESEKISFQEK